MSKILKPILTIIIGVVLGIFLYQQFSPQQRHANKVGDTSFVSEAHAEDSADRIYSGRKNAITTAVAKVSPAIVSINVTKVDKYIQRSPFGSDPYMKQFFPELFGDRIIEQPYQSVGSGFIISEDGYLLTNEHVVGTSEEIIVATGDGTEYKAELVGRDRVSDVALLKIDKTGLPYIRLGHSDKMLIGEWAIALGNPFGLFLNNSPTVTVGVISAENRDFSPIEGRVYEDMLQTDAAINSGNSGGPLCNADGDVVGMNTFIYTGNNKGGSVGVGFAIPSNHIKQVVEKLKKRGKGDSDIWIGLYGQDINLYIARLIGYPSTRGVLIKRLVRNSPAEKSGIELGDVLLSLNGIEVQNTRHAGSVIQSMDLLVGDKIKIQYWRKGEIHEGTIILEKDPH